MKQQVYVKHRKETQMLHLRTYTDERLSQLVRSHGRGGDGEIDVSFLAALTNELVRRGTNYIPNK